MNRCYLLDKVAFSKHTDRIRYKGPVQVVMEGYKKLNRAVLFNGLPAYSSFCEWVEKVRGNCKEDDLWIRKELTLATPPWDNVVVVMEQDGGIELCVHVVNLECNDFTDARSEEAKLKEPFNPNKLWLVTAWVLDTKSTHNTLTYMAFTAVVHTEPKGTLGSFSSSIIYNDQTLKLPALDSNWTTVCLYPFFVFQLLHCRGIKSQLLDAYRPTVPKGQRNKLPKISYHTLTIGDELVARQNGSDKGPGGLRKAKHLCRGSFARYTAEKPLFGRYVGLVWRPAHVRGNASKGIVGKDYQLASE